MPINFRFFLFGGPFLGILSLLGVASGIEATPSVFSQSSGSHPQIIAHDQKSASALDTGNMCGPDGLVLAAALAGIQLSQEQVLAHCPITSEGVSMLDLKKAAQVLGLKAEGCRLDWASLQKLEDPALLFVNGHHFFVAVPNRFGKNGDENSVLILDPPHTVRHYSHHQLEMSWRGEALVVSRPDASRPSSSPQAQFETLLADFGSIYDDQTTHYSFAFRNTGEAPLEISGIKRSCGCTTATVTKTSIAPGERATVDVTIALEGRQGAQRQQIYLATNDPEHPLVTLCYQGYSVKPYLVSVDNLKLGQALPGEDLSATAEILDRGDSSLRIQGLTATLDSEAPDSASTAAAIELSTGYSPLSGIKGETMEMSYPPQPTVVEIDPTQPVRYAIRLGARVSKQAIPGNYTGHIVVSTNDSRRPRLEIPFSLSVLEDLTVVPPSLNFGVAGRDSIVRREIVIRSRAGRTIAASPADLQMEFDGAGGARPVLERIDTAGTSATLLVALNIRELDPALGNGLVKGMLNARLSDGSRLQVPWMFLNKRAKP